MLTDLKDLLTNNNLIFHSNIRIPYYTSNFMLNYDDIKNNFTKTIRIPSPKSADYLDINISGNELVFIEEKDVSQIIIHNKSKFINIDEFQSFLQDKFDKFEIDNKIIDSYSLLLSIAGYYNINKSFYSNFLDKSKIKVKFFLLLKVDSREFV